MIIFPDTIQFKLQGLNLRKFLTTLSQNQIEVVEFKKIDYNLTYFTLLKKDEKRFLKIASKFSFKVDETKLPPARKIFRIIKNNVIFFICSAAMITFLFFSSAFVFKTKLIGLKNVSEREVISVLKANGFEMGKLKSNYKLDSIETLLTTHLEKISYASAVIKGSTLIVNIDEKIDNSAFIYPFSPLIAPFDCVLLSLELLSGTPLFSIGETVRAGEEIIAPYVTYANQTKLPVPAKASITAYTEISVFGEYDPADFATNSQKYIEEKEKELYNIINKSSCTKNLNKTLTQTPLQNSLLLTITLKGTISF